MDPLEYNRPSRLAAMIWTGVVAAYTTVVLPLIVTGVAISFGVPSARAGLIASAEMGGIAIGTLVASLIVARIDRRRLVVASIFVAVAANLVSIVPMAFTFLLPLRIISGLGSGGLLATMAAAVGATRNPDRNFGIFVAAAFVAAALSFGGLSNLTNAVGVAPLFGILALLNLSVLAAVPWFPRAAPAPNTQQEVTAAYRSAEPVMAVAGALIGILAFYIGVGTVWPMMGGIGAAFGIAPLVVGNILATTSLAALTGASGAAFVGIRFGRAVPLVIGLSATVSSLVWLVVTQAHAFHIAPLLFLLSWNFSVPYMMGTLAVLDRSGRAVAFNMTLQYVGFACGPLIAAGFARANTLPSVLWIGLTGCSVCLLCFVFALISTSDSNVDASVRT